MEEIRQFNKVIQSAEDGDHLQMIFNNLTGRNFRLRFDYRQYLKFVFSAEGYVPGPIEFWRDGSLVEKGVIASL